MGSTDRSRSVVPVVPGLVALALAVAVAATGCASTTSTSSADGTPVAQPTETTSAFPAHVPATSSAPSSPAPTSTRATAKPRTTRHRVTNGDVVLAGGIVLPNRVRTPGATNPAVTQATVHRTICRTGYTKTIRPSSSYTTSLKVHQLATGYAWHGDRDTGDYEEDHLISLELGGSPGSAKNLWPEPYAAAEGARAKDLVENKLHDLVCSGALSLRAAQRAIATNWWHAYQTYGGIAIPRVFDGAYGAAPTTDRTQTSSSGGTDPRFDTCKDAIAHGYGPYDKGKDPEYDWYRDADGDGVVCER